VKASRNSHLIALFAVFSLAACATTPEGKKLSTEDRAQLIMNVAAGDIEEGDPTGALIALQQAENLVPKSPELHHLKSLAFYYKKDIDAAVLEARKTAALAPNYSDANNTLGKLLIDQARYPEAIPYLKKAADDYLYRDAYKAQTNLGILYYKMGNFAQAETALNRAIETNSVMACAAYYYRGQIHLKNSLFETAVRDFEKATQKLCGNFEDAQFAIGVAYLRSKQYALARKKFLEIQKLYPDSAVADKAMEQLRYIP
jgi:Tfp pilus assembly protein PilF